MSVWKQFFSTSNGAPDEVERVDAGTFRQVMREVAAPVAVVASGCPGERNGLTATAVCAVSDTPPTVLACVHRNAQAHDLIVKSGCFSINFLSTEQECVAVQFSGVNGVHGEDRFSVGEWRSGLIGAPLLQDAVCTLECQLASHQSVATHTIFFGELVGGYTRSNARALLYLRGAYRSLAPAISRVQLVG